MDFIQFAKAVQSNVAQVVIGKTEATELLLVSLLVEGHVLIEDVPGIGKTTLAKALARSLDCSFARIQFTPDLLPSDVTGLSIFNQKAQSSSSALARSSARSCWRTRSTAPPRAPSRRCWRRCRSARSPWTAQTCPLPRPFLVLATQNPIELEGTFPLPEAQVDRFLMRVKLGYPTEGQEEEILVRYGQGDPQSDLKSVATAEEVVALQRQVRDVHVNPDVRHYITRVTRATREHTAVELGVSPRGTLALFRASQALAALRGRAYVIPSDVQHLCPTVLIHRVHISPQVRLRGRTPAQVVAEIIESVPVPVVE